MYEEKEEAKKYIEILKNGKKIDKVNLTKMQTCYVAGYL